MLRKAIWKHSADMRYVYRSLFTMYSLPVQHVALSLSRLKASVAALKGIGSNMFGKMYVSNNYIKHYIQYHFFYSL